MGAGFRVLLVATACGALAGLTAVRADEGMWLFNRPPRKPLKEKYDFDPSDPWLEHIQKASVRFNSGISGAFVSADGLVATNHVVVADTLRQNCRPGQDYLADGFLAARPEQEMRSSDIELSVLMGIEDVTAQVNAAVRPDMTAQEAFTVRRAAMAQIEKDSREKTGLRSDVVTLYQGAQYHLYRYKTYGDVRVVFAPEQQIASFGGDPANFEYPRYAFDVAFVRAYEGGKPARIEHYLTWSKARVADGELVFVAGHPTRTDRLITAAEMEYMRDQTYPYKLGLLYRQEGQLASWSARDEEKARRVQDRLFAVQNSRKARAVLQASLLDPKLLAAKKEEERRMGALDHEGKQGISPWTRVEGVLKEYAARAKDYRLLERADGFDSRLFRFARTLVRLAEETDKPNSERLAEYRDANLELLRRELFVDDLINDEDEQFTLANSLTWLTEQLGYKHNLVRRILDGDSPEERATKLVKGTRLKDVSERRKLHDGGRDALKASTDPMIALARLVDEEGARSARRVFEIQDEIKREASNEIALLKFKARADTYPEPTFTLRLSFGIVRGYEEHGKAVPYQTTFAGLYAESAAHHDRPPFDLPPRWKEQKNKLDLKTPLDFVCTADIVSGHSGSPVVNRNAEIVGIIFDSNLQALALNFAYTDRSARAVALHSRAVIEALRNLYGAGALADQLTRQR
jgi:hypothetical protein